MVAITASLARTPTAYAIAVLALVQAALGLSYAVGWLQLGGLLARSTRLPPVFGLAVLARGALTASVALLYVLFAWSVFRGQPWAREAGLVAATTNLMLLLSAVLREQFSAAGLLWGIVPVVVLCYALAHPRAERRNFEARS